MRSEKRRVSMLVGTATLGMFVVLALGPTSARRIFAGYVLVLATVALASLIRTLARGADRRPVSEFEYLLEREPEQPTRPPELLRIEREITLGIATAVHLHNRLLPLLREVASARLGYEIEQRPEAAAARLGAGVWQTLLPRAEAPEDPAAPGMPLRRIREVVTALEQA